MQKAYLALQLGTIQWDHEESRFRQREMLNRFVVTTQASADHIGGPIAARGPWLSPASASQWICTPPGRTRSPGCSSSLQLRAVQPFSVTGQHSWKPGSEHLGQRLAGFMYKEPDSIYLRLCSPCGLCGNSLTLLLLCRRSHRPWSRLCPVKPYAQKQAGSHIWLIDQHLLTPEGGSMVHNIHFISHPEKALSSDI